MIKIIIEDYLKFCARELSKSGVIQKEDIFNKIDGTMKSFASRKR